MQLKMFKERHRAAIEIDQIDVHHVFHEQLFQEITEVTWKPRLMFSK